MTDYWRIMCHYEAVFFIILSCMNIMVLIMNNDIIIVYLIWMLVFSPMFALQYSVSLTRLFKSLSNYEQTVLEQTNISISTHDIVNPSGAETEILREN